MTQRKPRSTSELNSAPTKIWLLATLFVAGLIACLSLVPNPPQMPSLLGWDKLQHAGAYGLLSLLIAQTLSSLPRLQPGNAWWCAALVAVCYGGLMEILQLLMHMGRTAEWWDLAADTLGVIICCVLFRQAAVIKSLRNRPFEETRG